MIESFGICDVGCVRNENQDRILMDHSLGLFAVADGMGGHRNGSIAAELAISTLRYYVESSRDRFDVSWPFGYSFELSMDANRLSTGIRLASRHVWHKAEQEPQNAGMGSTIAALLLGDSTAVIANVGDSRVYIFRDGKLAQLTQDDTWVNSLSGEAALLRNHEMRNVLTQAIGSQETVDVHIREQDLNREDIFLFSSDGLHAIVEQDAICSILAAKLDIQDMADRLLEAARNQQAPDNVSVVLLSYDR